MTASSAVSSTAVDEKTALERPAQQPISNPPKDSLERIASHNFAMDTTGSKDTSKAQTDLEHGNLGETKEGPDGPPAGGPTPGMDPTDFPDGGCKAWLALFGGWCGTVDVFWLQSCLDSRLTLTTRV